ncbi:hypothetical protein C6A77_09270 [Pseudomonas sp. AFG_SD02_1510_Pfu_092]|nr:hypothetical protein C6A77_09270 [Pseudomonas sp. AFG_SD02_1510_Pfu_092]
MDGTGCAGVRGHGRSHRYRVSHRPARFHVGAGKPAKQATRWMAPAAPVFAAMAAPTGCCMSHRPARFHVGAGKPAKQAERWMAPAAPVFAAKAAPTVLA